MLSNHVRNTEGLSKFREKKSTECLARVDKTIQHLLKEKEKITFNSVAARANVSKKYLYDNHFDRIDMLRKQQEGLSSPKQVKREMTDASKDVLIASKNKKLKELQQENARLKSLLERKFGEIYEK